MKAMNAKDSRESSRRCCSTETQTTPSSGAPGAASLHPGGLVGEDRVDLLDADRAAVLHVEVAQLLDHPGRVLPGDVGEDEAALRLGEPARDDGDVGDGLVGGRAARRPRRSGRRGSAVAGAAPRHHGSPTDWAACCSVPQPPLDRPERRRARSGRWRRCGSSYAARRRPRRRAARGAPGPSGSHDGPWNGPARPRPAGRRACRCRRRRPATPAGRAGHVDPGLVEQLPEVLQPLHGRHRPRPPPRDPRTTAASGPRRRRGAGAGRGRPRSGGRLVGPTQRSASGPPVGAEPCGTPLAPRGLLAVTGREGEVVLDDSRERDRPGVEHPPSGVRREQVGAPRRRAACVRCRRPPRRPCTTTSSQSASGGRSSEGGGELVDQPPRTLGLATLQPEHGRLGEQRGHVLGPAALLAARTRAAPARCVRRAGGRARRAGSATSRRHPATSSPASAASAASRAAPTASPSVSANMARRAQAKKRCAVVLGLVGEQVQRRELASDGAEVELFQRGRQAPQVGLEAYAGIGRGVAPGRGAAGWCRAGRRGRRGRRGWSAGHRGPPRAGPGRRAPRRAGRPRRRTAAARSGVAGVGCRQPERLACAFLEIPRPHHGRILGGGSGPRHCPTRCRHVVVKPGGAPRPRSRSPAGARS